MIADMGLTGLEESRDFSKSLEPRSYSGRFNDPFGSEPMMKASGLDSGCRVRHKETGQFGKLEYYIPTAPVRGCCVRWDNESVEICAAKMLERV